jgi:beta-galactosidase
VADVELTRTLDVTAGNPYYGMQDDLLLPARPEPKPRWHSQDTWAFYRAADRLYSSRQESFYVTETNAHAIGPSWGNQPAYDGQWRQAAWALVARGASMIEYWHWRTLPFGAETYWAGVLPHSGRPGRAYREIARIGAELERAGELVAQLVPDADITMLYSHLSEWALTAQPPLTAPAGGPDTRSYETIFDAFYRGAFDAGLQTRILHAAQAVAKDPAEAAERHPVLVAPALYVCDDDTLDWLTAYAQAGGHLVLGPRSCYADDEVRARRDIQPAGLTEAAGVWYDEFSNLDAHLPVHSSQLKLPEGAAATGWADGLHADDADVLAGYSHPHFGRFAAMTTKRYGKGRITYAGTVPNPALSAALFRWLVPDAGPWTTLPTGVTSTGATAQDGRRIRFLHNWSWQVTTVTMPVTVRDVLDDTDYAPGAQVQLGPWDVRVLLES